MADWCDTEPFERLSLLTTQCRFLDGIDWDVKRGMLRAQMQPHFRTLGFDPNSPEQCAKFDVEFGRRQEALRCLPYDEYLRTEHWQTVRAGALARARFACQVCAATGSLHVHHRSYEHRGDEGPDDVTVLCADCHLLFHENRQVTRK